MKAFAVVSLVSLIALMGCGRGGSTKAQTGDEGVTQSSEIAYQICAVTPEAQLAKEFHTEQNWAAIGHAYGQGYREPFNVAAEEGCMAALIDSSAERDAAFKMMEG